MIPLSTDTPEEAFTQFARDWFRSLARGDFSAAARALDEPNYYGQSWSADAIRRDILDYTHGEPFAVTDPDILGSDPHPGCGAFDDGSGYWFDATVPLSGEWSDLTAQFEFVRRPSGFAVRLHALHVL